MSPRILPQRIFKEKGIKPQASVQEWFRISCTCASVATLPRPKLMPEMLRLAEELEASSKKAAESGDLQKSLADGRLADIYRDFHGAQYDPRDPTTKTELRKNSGPENGQPRGMLTWSQCDAEEYHGSQQLWRIWQRLSIAVWRLHAKAV